MRSVTVATTTLVVVASRFAAVTPLEQTLYTNGTAIIPIVKHASLIGLGDTVDLNALHSHSAFVKAIRRGLENHEQEIGTKPVVGKNTSDPVMPGTALELTGYKKVMWYGNIAIGTPPTTFSVDIDTGTAEFFVPSSACDSSCNGHTRWVHDKYSTAQPIGKSFDVKFSSGGRVSGLFYSDNVTVGGLTADIQIIGAATKYSSEFQRSKFPPDGTMGLAFRTLASSGDNTVFETLISEGKVSNQVFSLMLAATDGELYLGGMNSELYDGNLAYTQVTKQAYWQVKMQYVKGNGKPILRDIDAIIDSGSDLVFGRAKQVYALHRRLNGKAAPPNVGSGVYTFPCTNFPSVSLMFSGTGRSFPISNLNLGRVSSGSPDCISGIVEIDDNSPFWVIGGVFLQGVYTTFDVRNKRVGFAALARVPGAGV